MPHTATITTRIDPKLKNKATKIVEGLGDENQDYSPAFVKMVLEADEEAKDSDLKAYSSVDEAFDDILGKDWRNAQSQV